MSEERKSRYELFLEAEQEAPQTKRCSKCRETKALGEYHRRARSKLGVNSRCKACVLVPGRGGKIFKNRIDRFWKFYWSRIRKNGECQEWMGYYNNKMPSCSFEGRGNVSVRRLVYQLAIGELSGELRVIATCKNHKCVRHSHLQAITRDEMNVIVWNTNPMGDDNGSRKHPESRPCGSQIKQSKLTETDITTIRELRSSKTYSQKQIAQMFGVSRDTIRHIVIGRTWKHIK